MSDYDIALLFVGGLIGMGILYLVSACAGLIRVYRLSATQHDRDASLLREVRAAADRLQVADRG